MQIPINILDEMKGFCIICLLLLNVLQIILLCILYKRGEHKKLYFHLFLALCVFASISLIDRYFFKANLALMGFSMLCTCVLVFVFSVYFIKIFIHEFRSSKEKLTNNAVKDAFDTLPAGVAFFSDKGIPVLCNKKIHEVAHMIMGKDMQSLYELEEALKNPNECVEKFYIGEKQAYRLENGRVGTFTRKEIYDKNGIKYTQVVTTNLTELYQLQQELKLRNNELQKMIERIQRIAENMADITRQQEILTAKMRIHNKMGNSLLAMRRYIVQERPKEQKENVLKIWSDTLDELYM